MEWLNLHLAKQVRSPQAIGSSPAEFGTWVRLLAYCAEQENGGRVVGGAQWKDRQWQQACAITRREIQAADRLIRVDGDDVVANGYNLEVEAKLRGNRRGGSAGALGRWGHGADARETRSQRLAAARAKGTHSNAQWMEMRSYYACCVRCGALDGTVEIVKDHITPIYQGGSDSIANLQPLCTPCNSAKGSESTDWRQKSPKGCLQKWLQTPDSASGLMPGKEKEKEKEKEKRKGEGEAPPADLIRPLRGWVNTRTRDPERTDENQAELLALVEEHGGARIEAIARRIKGETGAKPWPDQIAQALAAERREPTEPDPCAPALAVLAKRGHGAVHDLLELDFPADQLPQAIRHNPGLAALVAALDASPRPATTDGSHDQESSHAQQEDRAPEGKRRVVG